MANERGWVNRVYNPDLPYWSQSMARRMIADGFRLDNLPEIRGVQFRRSKNEHKPMRNVVTWVVMVGFDPFNHSGLPEHIERKVVFDFYARLENDFVLSWVKEAIPGEQRLGLIAWADGYKLFSPMEGEQVPHNPMLTVRENFQLDQIRSRMERNPAKEPVFHAIEVVNGRIYAENIPEAKFEDYKARRPLYPSTMCPEVEIQTRVLFPFAGHMWVDTHSNFHVPGITGVVELHIPKLRTSEEMELILQKTSYAPRPIELFEGELHLDFDGDQPILHGTHLGDLVEITAEDIRQCITPSPFNQLVFAHYDAIEAEQRSVSDGVRPYFSQFAGITKSMSQTGRDETMARYLIKERPDHPLDELLMPVDLNKMEFMPAHYEACAGEPEVLTPEDIQEREQAIQDASEGKLDYLLEGTQHDPRNRK